MFVSLFMGLFGSAFAEDVVPQVDPSEKDIIAEVDAAFGEYFVGPLASVLFWDVMFWDNTLADGEGVGTIVDGQYVLSYDKSYQLQEQFSAPKESLTIRLNKPVSTTNDFFTWTITQTPERTLSASIPYTTVPTLEVELIPLEEWEGDVPEATPVEAGKERFVTEALTEKGLPIFVDRKIAGKEEVEPLPPYEVVAVTMPVSMEKFPIEVGASVWVDSKKEDQKAAE